MAQVLVLERQDGSTEIAFIGSPYLAVLFEEAFHRGPDGASDVSWMAYVDRHDNREPEGDELKVWLQQFISTDTIDYVPGTGTPNPPSAPANGATEPEPENSSLD